jgi:hypothetical protein
MKHKLKTGGILALALFLVYLYGCQKEELEIEQPIPTKGIPFEVEVPQVESYFVAESSKGKVIDKLFKALGYTTRTGGNVTESYETGIGTILTDEILAVQDVFGTKYTFKLDHPEKDFYTFFNLVMVDKGEEVVVLLKKYIMTEEFANLYRSDQKTVDDFDGSVATTLLTNPCLCEFPNEGEPEIVYPGDYTPGGSGGGGTVAGSGPSGPVGGGTGGTTHCFLISFTMTHTITYTNGNSHTKTKRYTLDTCTGIITVNNKGTKTSKDGNNQTETYNENDCCSFGAIGIMDDNESQDDPCKELKKIKDSPNYNHTINFLKNKANGNKEYGWIYRKFLDSGGLQPPSVAGQLTSDNNKVDLDSYTGHEWIGAIHNHTNPTITNSIQMFSPEDVHWLLRRARNVNAYNIANSITTNFGDFFLGLVIQNHTYVIKIKDWNQFSSSLNHQDDVIEFYNELNELYDYLGSQASQVSLQKAFLKTIKKFNIGISLFEQDNSGVWNELKLNSTNPNDLPIKVPCN